MALHNANSPKGKSRAGRIDQSILPYLILDAGGTVVFPNETIIIRQAKKYGIELTHEQLYRGYYQLIHQLDQSAIDRGYFTDLWPKGYAFELFETLGILNPETHTLAEAITEEHLRRNLWTFTYDWVCSALLRLKSMGYRMSILSNSDGRTARVFHELKLDSVFEAVFDSKVLGVEKPDPAIFYLILDELGLKPFEAFYIGDIYNVDVKGANQAGVGAIHIDPLKLYSNWLGVHLQDIRWLPAWLIQYQKAPRSFDLHPFTRILSNTQPISPFLSAPDLLHVEDLVPVGAVMK
jgi:putative hydrolase of the HAD superfamily